VVLNEQKETRSRIGGWRRPAEDSRGSKASSDGQTSIRDGVKKTEREKIEDRRVEGDQLKSSRGPKASSDGQKLATKSRIRQQRVQN
jgi:hypothetical protein